MRHYLNPSPKEYPVMSSLAEFLSFTPSGTQTAQDEALNYEWAEFNLPAATDMTLLRDQLDCPSMREAAV